MEAEKKRVICILKDHPELDSRFSALDQLIESTLERTKFLAKSMADLQKKYNDDKGKLWEEVYSVLKDKGMFPAQHNPDKDNFYYEGGALFEEKDGKNKGPCIHDLLKGLIGLTE